MGRGKPPNVLRAKGVEKEDIRNMKQNSVRRRSVDDWDTKTVSFVRMFSLCDFRSNDDVKFRFLLVFLV
jgi:hypothetical protein